MGLAGKLAGQGRDLVIVMNVSQSRRMLAAMAAAAATLAALAPASAAPAGAAARATRAAPGAQLWVARYNGQANSGDFAHSMAVSPGGSRVFVTGGSDGGPATGDDYATAAYSAAAGGQLWASRYSGAGDHADIARSVAVSPGGSRVFVTGESHGRGTGEDYATLAYSAATGRQLWVSRYNGPANRYDAASSVAVSPRGGRVYVTGTSRRLTLRTADATIAYSAATGKQLWVSRYNGPADGSSGASAVAVSPAGTTVYVTGGTAGPTGADYATVAYSAAAGTQLWASRYNGPDNEPDGACCLAVSPDGTTVLVTGQSDGLTTSADYATVAYRG
jgi:DNA-binding beta-propeller fold protein YncE